MINFLPDLQYNNHFIFLVFQRYCNKRNLGFDDVTNLKDFGGSLFPHFFFSDLIWGQVVSENLYLLLPEVFSHMK